MRIRIFFLVLLLLLGSGSRAETTILVYGDSLSAAYGIPREAGWVHLLAQRLAQRHPTYRVVNASVSGETTAGGLTRLPEVLAAHRPAITILALGANDGLRGLPSAHTAGNLEAMIDLVTRQGGRVLLVGMRLPPNYGTAYTRKFQETFTRVAAARKVPLVPFLLEGVGGDLSLFLADGLHPNERAQPRLLENVWQGLLPLLTPAAARR